MVIAVGVLAAVLCVVVGYAAGQREVLLAGQKSIEELTTENVELKNRATELESQIRNHEFSLELVLEEMGKS